MSVLTAESRATVTKTVPHAYKLLEGLNDISHSCSQRPVPSSSQLRPWSLGS